MVDGYGWRACDYRLAKLVWQSILTTTALLAFYQLLVHINGWWTTTPWWVTSPANLAIGGVLGSAGVHLAKWWQRHRYARSLRWERVDG